MQKLNKLKNIFTGILPVVLLLGMQSCNSDDAKLKVIETYIEDNIGTASNLKEISEIEENIAGQKFTTVIFECDIKADQDFICWGDNKNKGWSFRKVNTDHLKGKINLVKFESGWRPASNGWAIKIISVQHI